MERAQQMGMAANEGILPAVSAFLNREHGLFIEGKWQPATSGQVFSVQNPATGCEISRIAMADADYVRHTVESAHRGFRDGRWRRSRFA